jgi:carbon monoxide dehydrogenase subunit G
MLKKILIGLAVIAVLFVGVVAIQPSELNVNRTITIATPPAAVFPHVNDLHKWEVWSPWAKLDPKSKIEHSGAPEGEGAVFTWDGNDKVGEGRMTIAKSQPDELVSIDLVFVRPFESESKSEFAFKPDGSNTSVTWTVSGHHGFIHKAMCLIFDGKGMLAKDLEKGLAQLKDVAEKAPATPAPAG